MFDCNNQTRLRFNAHHIDETTTDRLQLIVADMSILGLMTLGQRFSYEEFYTTVWPGEMMTLEQYAVLELRSYLLSTYTE